MRSDYDIAVIGAGASGMAAAISAARSGARTVLLEALPRAGKKLLATGNGRCNISNAGVTAVSCRTGSPQTVAAVYDALPAPVVWDFLRSLGLSLEEEDEGRMYPRSNQASAVLDMLRFELERLGVPVLCEWAAQSLRREGGCFRIVCSAGNVTARRVIMACGSKASPQLGGSDSGVRILRSVGHTAAPMHPSLVPLRCSSPLLRSLKGVRVRCRAELWCKGRLLYADSGEVQFADQSLSGIVIFQLSARLARSGTQQAELRLDLMPDMTVQQVEQLLCERRTQQGYLTLENFLSGLFNKKIGIALMKSAADLPMTEPASRLSSAQVKRLASAIKAWSFTTDGAAPWQQAQCMSGGIRLEEFSDRLESRIVPGLYACGELLDCDCDCGGYNLHWAWTSGITAGRAAARSLNGEQY